MHPDLQAEVHRIVAALPARMSQAQAAKALGMTRRNLRETEASALTKIVRGFWRERITA